MSVEVSNVGASIKADRDREKKLIWNFCSATSIYVCYFKFGHDTPFFTVVFYYMRSLCMLACASIKADRKKVTSDFVLVTSIYYVFLNRVTPKPYRILFLCTMFFCEIEQYPTRIFISWCDFSSLQHGISSRKVIMDTLK